MPILEYETSYGKAVEYSIDSDCQRIFLESASIAHIDLSCLALVKHLKKLELGDNDLVSINLSSLECCTELQTLGLSDNQLREVDLQPLCSCTELRRLGLICNNLQVIDISPLSSCPRFEGLYLGENRLDSLDFSPLAASTELEYLEISTNRFQELDLSPAVSWEKLKFLNLSWNQLRSIDLSSLSSCTELEMLLLNDNQLRAVDLSPLVSCVNLEELALRGNKLQSVDFAPLASCEQIRRVDVWHNMMKSVDITPILLSNPNAWIRSSDYIKDLTFLGESTIDRFAGNRIDIEHNVPIVFQSLEFIKKIIPIIREERLVWKRIHLLQCVMNAVGLEELGYLDLYPNKLLDEVESGMPANELRETILTHICEQIDRSGTTAGLDIDKAKGFGDLAVRIPRIIHLRKKEIESVEVPVDNELVDLRPLWMTAYGHRLLKSLHLGTTCSNEDYRMIERVLFEVGFRIATTEKPVKKYPANISEELCRYIWRIAEYNAETLAEGA